MELQTWIRKAQQSLQTLVEPSEAEAVLAYLLEEKYQLSRNLRWTDPAFRLDEQRWQELEADLGRLQKQEPVQYLVGHAWMLGLKWKVVPGVLIPRPETEQLADMVIRQLNGSKVLLADICSGSGCLGGSIAHRLGCELLAVDYFPEPLRLTKENLSVHLSTPWSVQAIDVLNSPLPLEKVNALVCNPPYVLPSEKESMEKNVLHYEPSEALFIPEEDPLLFYRVIGQEAIDRMPSGGQAFWEINAALAEETVSLFVAQGWHEVVAHADMQGRNRFVFVKKPS